MHRIRVTRRGRVVTELALEGAVSVGRTVDNVLRLPEQSVSGHHATLELTDDGCLLTDLASRNGTVVDGERLEAGSSMELAGGERISVGSYEITYVPPNMTTEIRPEDLGPEWTDDAILPPRPRRRRGSERALSIAALIVSVIALVTVVLSRVL